MKKRCARCGKRKDISKFNRHAGHKDGYSTSCRICDREMQRAKEDRRKAEHPEKHAMAVEKRRAANAAARAVAEAKRIAEYDLRLSEQGGVCAICGLPPEEGGPRFARDHDHATGKLRKLLCRSCNYGLGCFKDNPAFLRAAADYLESFL